MSTIILGTLAAVVFVFYMMRRRARLSRED
jgi:hypothetical protein